MWHCPTETETGEEHGQEGAFLRGLLLAHKGSWWCDTRGPSAEGCVKYCRAVQAQNENKEGIFLVGLIKVVPQRMSTPLYYKFASIWEPSRFPVKAPGREVSYYAHVRWWVRHYLERVPIEQIWGKTNDWRALRKVRQEVWHCVEEVTEQEVNLKITVRLQKSIAP